MPPTRKVAVSACYKAVQCNGIYKNLLTKILSGYLFAETRTSGGYPTLVYSILLNIATKLELRKATHVTSPIEHDSRAGLPPRPFKRSH